MWFFLRQDGGLKNSKIVQFIFASTSLKIKIVLLKEIASKWQEDLKKKVQKSIIALFLSLLDHYTMAQSRNKRPTISELLCMCIWSHKNAKRNLNKQLMVFPFRCSSSRLSQFFEAKYITSKYTLRILVTITS